MNKIQALAKKQATQRTLQESHPEWTNKPMKVLGAILIAKRRQNDPVETERISVAIQRAHKLSILPRSFAQKLSDYQTLCLSKAAYGWISKLPTQQTCNKLFNALTRTVGRNRMANPLIRAWIYGGNKHLQPVNATRMLCRITRLRSCYNNLAWTTTPFTQVAIFRRWLAQQNWTEEQPWTWKHSTCNLKISIPTTFHKADVAAGSHAIRQVWRFNTLQQWANGERHEAKQWRNTIPTEPVKDMLRLDQEWIRQKLMHGSAENRAVLLGSTVSPAWLAVSSHKQTAVLVPGATCMDTGCT